MIAIHRPFDLYSGMSASTLYWKPLSRPTDHATGHAAHVRETSLLQELYGGDAAVSALQTTTISFEESSSFIRGKRLLSGI